MQLVLVAYVVGTDAINARALVRELADRVARQALGQSNAVDIDEPHLHEDESIRVAALIGPTELEPSAAVTALTVEEHDNGPHICAEWQAETVPQRGYIRLELHAVPAVDMLWERA